MAFHFFSLAVPSAILKRERHGIRISAPLLPEYLEGRTPKENALSFFKMHSPPAKSEMQGVFFFRGCRRTRRAGGALVALVRNRGRTAGSRATTHAERGKAGLLRMLAKVGSNV